MILVLDKIKGGTYYSDVFREHCLAYADDILIFAKEVATIVRVWYDVLTVMNMMS